MAGNRALRKEVNERIAKLKNLTGSDFDNEAAKIKELMDLAEIPPDSSIRIDHEIAVEVHERMYKPSAPTTPPKPVVQQYEKQVQQHETHEQYKKPDVMPVAPGRQYERPVQRPDSKQPLNQSQNVFKGRIGIRDNSGTMVSVKQTPSVVWVSETYAGEFRVNWGFSSEFCGAELFNFIKHHTDLFLRVTDIGGLVTYSPLSDGYLEKISRGLSQEKRIVQAGNIINYGLGLCDRILFCLSRNDFDSYADAPLSRLLHRDDICAVLDRNAGLRAEVYEERPHTDHFDYQLRFWPRG